MTITLLSGCARYIPTNVITTNFENQGEGQVVAAASINAVFLNVAYSPLKYTYVHLEGGNTLLPSPVGKNRAFNYSGGIGWYYPITEKFHLESQLKIGRGEFDNYNYDERGGWINYTAGWLAVTYKTDKNLIFSLIGGKNYQKGTYEDIDWGPTGIYNGELWMIYANLKQQVKKDNYLTLTIGSEDDYLPYTNEYAMPIVLRIGYEWKFGNSKQQREGDYKD